MLVSSIVVNKEIKLDQVAKKLNIEIDQELKKLYLDGEASLKEVCIIALIGSGNDVHGNQWTIEEAKHILHSL